MKRYKTHLDATVAWLYRSIDHGKGGSCAYFGVWGRWAPPYPETTGYIIPTLLHYARVTGASEARERAMGLGNWLLGIQDEGGYWHGGTHPPARPNPSIFNTGQILLGLCALFDETEDAVWLDAARAGARWLAQGVNGEGEWEQGNYRDGFNPSYYTRVAWPMLEVWKRSGDEPVHAAAVRVLDRILSRRRANGVIQGWGFDPERPAFTHTIAYTLRGLLESARLLDDWKTYGAPTETALERLYRQAELYRGRLAGAYDEAWRKDDRFSCLTGNVQTAICLLKYEARSEDLRLVNAACKLVDYVCSTQSLRHPHGGIRGGIAGSRPVWGRYMALRYPNWAAKFHADALMLLMERLEREA
ncbi:hypothetical protein GQ464_004240 [Rhodocaloribacter litoris]|uniref:hypothetical protein n=1 Tax=Rhodocaloribacter litoris TaxID=2558931 RepID=UPI001E516EFC|nr:hypothetical protein [Rhodocaloribacter litoris]QXD16169.1 hypothetical protein GQ464_004240 [Rhodocaloribacter litoris]